MNILFTRSEYYGTPRIAIVCGFTFLEIHVHQDIPCSYHCTISHLRSDDINSIVTGSGSSLEEMWEDLRKFDPNFEEGYGDQIELEQYVVNNFALLNKHLNS